MTEKLDMTSPDLVSQNIERIAALFPNCVTESAGGKAIDFDLLRQELSTEMVEGPKERYRLEWPGKREAIVTANMPTTNTLRPVREDSVNFDTTENVYIEGDNLEVLKLLQESYLGKVKMIYIDPPYNTGNDFVYNDSFAKDAEISNLESGLTDEEGNRLLAKDPMQANPETAGRYHSDWLTMMYPRLKLARNLLTDDGVIFISIDDNEVHNLRKICDEVFGEVNFLVNIVWEKRFTRSNNSKTFTTLTENVLCYRKSEILDEIKEPRNEKSDSIYSNPDGDPRGIWTSVSIVNPATKEQRPNLSYVIKNPHSGEEIEHPTNAWKVERKRYEIYENENRLYWGRSGENKYPRLKKFLSDMEGGMVPVDLWSHKDTGTTDQGSKELENLFERKLFDFPKPPSLIKRMLNIATQPDSIILDFFSGSSTTAHAVMQLNAEDGGKRKFIMVQLPEKIDEKSEAYKAGYQNICEIGKERIRRAGAKLTSSDSSKGVDNTLQFEEAAEKKPVDTGFRVYRLDTSNMQDVYYRPQDYKQEMMNELFANHIKTDRTADDLVAQVMLDWGLPLSLTIEQTKIAGKTVYKVDGNALYCCFDDNIDESFARSVAPNAPMRIVFHDHSFANDTAKENVRQLLKQLSRDTEMKVV